MLKYILFCGKIPQERNNTLLTISFIDKDLESNNKNNNKEVYRVLYQKFFDWLLKWLNLWFKLRSFIDSDCSCYDRAWHSTCSTKSLLGTNKYIRHILKSKNEASCHCFFLISIFYLTHYTLTSVCIFSILISIQFLRHWQEEFVQE